MMILRHRLRSSLLRDHIDGALFEKHIKAMTVHFALLQTYATGSLTQSGKGLAAGHSHTPKPSSDSEDLDESLRMDINGFYLMLQVLKKNTE